MRWSFERVAHGLGLAEGPVWNGREVLFSDTKNSVIWAYSPTARTCTKVHERTNEANGLALDAQGRLLACEGGGFTGVGRRVVRYEPDGSRTVLADAFRGLALNEPNDLFVDERSRVWFTDPCYGDRSKMQLLQESVYRVEERDGAFVVERVVSALACPDGIVLSPNGATLYVSESPPPERKRNALLAYPVSEDGTLGDAKLIHDFGRERGADGMCFDPQGRLVAAVGSNRVTGAAAGAGPRLCVFSSTGEMIEEHPVPEDPTKPCFAEDGRAVYVTTMNGALYRAELAVE